MGMGQVGMIRRQDTDVSARRAHDSRPRPTVTDTRAMAASDDDRYAGDGRVR